MNNTPQTETGEGDDLGEWIEDCGCNLVSSFPERRVTSGQCPLHNDMTAYEMTDGETVYRKEWLSKEKAKQADLGAFNSTDGSIYWRRAAHP